MPIVDLAAPTYTTEYIAMNIEKTRKESKYARFLPTDQAGCFIHFVLEATGQLEKIAQI